MKKSKCETCEYKGYSPEVCKLHSSKGGATNEDQCGFDHPLKRVGKTLAFGAGAGVAAAFAGIAVAPVIGLKALLGHAVAAKITAGGVAGAGVNIARKWKKNSEGPSRRIRKRKSLLPMYLKG